MVKIEIVQNNPNDKKITKIIASLYDLNTYLRFAVY